MQVLSLNINHQRYSRQKMNSKPQISVLSTTNYRNIPYAKTPLSFNGYLGYTNIINKKSGEVSKAIHETYFFRDSKTLNFVSDYIGKNFKNGTHIAEYGCSTGEETYSLGMLLNDINKDNRYKITGYDISEDIVGKAKNGIHNIGGFEAHDFFLSCPADTLPSDQQHMKKLFDQFFGSYKDKKSGESYYKLKDETLNNSIDFKCGDIKEVGKKGAIPENTGAIIFKNAWYHLQDEGLETVEKVIKDIHKTLPEQGLLVVGSLSKDHMLTSEKPNGKIINPATGKEINIRTGSAFQKLLEKNGFRPVFYDTPSTYHPSVVEYMVDIIHLPSVWVKQ